MGVGWGSDELQVGVRSRSHLVAAFDGFLGAVQVLCRVTISDEYRMGVRWVSDKDFSQALCRATLAGW